MLARWRALCCWGVCRTTAPCVLVLPAVTHHVDIDITQYQIESLFEVIIVAVPPFLLPLLFCSPVSSVSVISIFPPSPVMIILIIAAILVANVRSSLEQSLHHRLSFPSCVLQRRMSLDRRLTGCKALHCLCHPHHHLHRHCWRWQRWRPRP
jgi:hypothetical protein